MASYIRTADHLTIVFDDGVSATVYANTANSTYAEAAKFKDVRDALNAKNFDLARRLALPAENVKVQMRDTFGIPEEQVTVEHGIVKYEGKEMDNSLTKRMLQMLEEGFDISPLKLFLINLQQNPSYRAVNELYGFLEKGNLPITEDGYFLAYKKVRGDYRDCHTGTIDNSIGQVVAVPRNTVDEDSRNECSNGLHFCSREYLSNFGGEHTMIVKVNPADVVAIPADYNSSKGRTCRYEVIGELDAKDKLEGSYRDTGTRPAPAPGAVTDLDDDWLEEYDDLDDELDDIDEWVGCSLESLLAEENNVVGGEEDLSKLQGSYSEADFERAAEQSAQAVDGVAVVERGGIDPLASSFVGIPGDGEPVVIPHDIALEIASSLDDEDVWSIAAYEVDDDSDEEILYGMYKNLRDASEITGANISSIRKALNGTRKTAGGFVWKRVATNSNDD